MGKFAYINSAAFYPAHGGLGVYTKWGKTDVTELTMVEQEHGYIWLKAPDREILVTGDGHTHGNLRPLDAGFDEYIALSPFFESTWKDHGVEWMMTNYPQHVRKVAAGNCRSPREGRTQWMADSGGFQLAMGRCDYIDPEDVAKWYDDNTDVGIVLDVPTLVGERELLMRAAKIQRQNTEIMKDVVQRASLMTVLHGANYKEYQDYHEAIHDPSIRSIAIGGSYKGDLMSAVADVAHFMLSAKDDYDHFHLLGVYNPAVLISYFWMANHGPFKLITSDASSQIQSAMGRLYHQQQYTTSPMRRIPIGLSKDIKQPNIHRRFPCSCPVCSTLGHTDFLSCTGGALSYFLLMNHNIFVINDYMRMMDEYARTLPFKEYRALCFQQLRTDRRRDDAIKALDMIQHSIEHGMVNTRKKYNHLLSHNRLFDSRKNEPPELHTAEGEAVEKTVDEWKTIIDGVMDRYENANYEKKQFKANVKKKGEKKRRMTNFNQGKRVRRSRLRSRK